MALDAVLGMQSSTDREAFKLTIFDGVHSNFQLWQWQLLSYIMYKAPELTAYVRATVVVPARLTLEAAVAARRAQWGASTNSKSTELSYTFKPQYEAAPVVDTASLASRKAKVTFKWRFCHELLGTSSLWGCGWCHETMLRPVP